MTKTIEEIIAKTGGLPLYRPLTPIELQAILLFASEEGRKWKATLNEVYWYNARIWRPRAPIQDAVHGYVLHGLRNSHGPSWLDGFRLPKQN